MRYCVVKNCGVKSSSLYRLFAFPKNMHFKQLWLDNLQISENVLSMATMVCSQHFELSSIGTGRLREGAVPTLKLGYKVENSTLHQFEPIEKSKGAKCLVPGCFHTSPPSTVYGIPSDPVMRKKWLNVIGVSMESVRAKRLYVCKEHFPADRKRTDQGIIPTLNLPPRKTDVNFDAELSADNVSTFTDPLAFDTVVISDNHDENSHGEANENSNLNRQPNLPINNVNSINKNPSSIQPNVYVPEPVPARSISIVPKIDATTCLATTKRVMKTQPLTAKEKTNLNRIELFHQELQALINKHNIQSEKLILLPPEASKEAVFFAKAICGKIKSYSDSERNILQNVHFHGPECYSFMRDTLNFRLPNTSILQMWNPIQTGTFYVDLIL